MSVSNTADKVNALKKQFKSGEITEKEWAKRLADIWRESNSQKNKYK